MRFLFAALWLLTVFPSMGSAQLRITTDKDTLNYSFVKMGFYRDASVRVTNISLTTDSIKLAKIVDQNSVPLEFKIVVPQPPIFHIDSGDGRTVIIRFTPSGPGVRTAMLDLMTSDGDKLVQLIGIGASIQPDILIKPLSIDFGMLAPGEFKDTTILVIGGGKDSATIGWIGVTNDNGEVDFDVTPVDKTITFPIIVRNTDTLKLNARFTGMNTSGPRTGRTEMQGEVSGEVICEFRGAVGVPDMTFAPQILDLGIVPQGSSVDTFISVASIGESSVNLQGIDKPNLPYTFTALPSFPRSIKAGDSLKVAVHFDASSPGDFEEPILAYSKNGSQTALNRTALLKAIVVPRVLSISSPAPLAVSCAIDSVYQRVVTITDTGSFPISITGVNCADSGFTLQYPVSLPDNIVSGGKRDILVTFNSQSGAISADTFCVVNIMNGNRVVIADTIHIKLTPENARFAVTQIPSTTFPTSNNIGVVSVSDLARYHLTSLDMQFTINPPDVAEIDTLNVKVDNSIFPNTTVTAGYDNATKKYVAHIVSQSVLPSSPVIPFLQIPLKYFVARDSSALIQVSMVSPEKDGCLDFADQSVTITLANGCGDEQIRNFLSGVPLLSAVNISPNPSHSNHVFVSFMNSADISLSSELFDISGKVVIHHDGATFIKGRNAFTFEIPAVPSGAYSLHLTARTADGHIHEVSSSIILSH